MRCPSRIVVGTTVVFLALGALAQNHSAGAGTGRAAAAATARTPQGGHIFTPSSSIERPGDAGLRAHTNYVFKSADGISPARFSTPVAMNTVTTNSTIEEAETPASLGCLYVSSPAKRSTGCVPNYASGTGGPSQSGWGAIALVDAFDNPTAGKDLATFDTYWGLKGAHFVKIYANGNGDCVTPPPDSGWALEESLDIEWAHVYAPHASIILVEACSNSYTDLLYAEGVAINYIQANYGGGQVSNSWGSGEFSAENGYDPIFAGWNYAYYIPVVTFASAGDSGCGAAYPSSNPWLVSAGGTGVLRDSVTAQFVSESCWGGSGGGSSTYETYATGFTGSNTGPWADYQYPIFGQGSRQTPDFASDADPNSGVFVYCGYDGGWFIVGGTSVASPSLASIVNRSGNHLSTWFGYNVVGFGYFTNEENNLLYAQLPDAKEYYTNFYDVTTGSNGCTVADHWDYCTGVGSPRDTHGK